MKKNPAMRIISVVIFLLLIQAGISSADAQTQKGTISVSSEPQGAEIYLNDEYLGIQTNTFIQDVFPGIHYVRLELEGYRTWEQIFEVREGEITYVSHGMEPVVGGPFTVSTKPEGAQIYIDGDFFGISNTILYDLPEGQHRVLLVLYNYSDYAATVTINEGISQSVVHTFETIPTTGRITVASVPSNAEIYLNGEFEGTTRKTLQEVVPGTYDVVIKKNGYDDWTGRVDVAAGKISEVIAELSPSKVLILVNTVPEEVSVSIDGVYSGTTPLEIPSEQGLHTIRIEKFGYERIETEVDVGAEGASFSYNLISMAPQAIAEAKQVVSENLEYRPKKAQEALLDAQKKYEEGDSQSAITYAESAIIIARDVDGDGVSNPFDISPNLHNIVIYISPFILLFLVLVFLGKDMLRHRVNPEIDLHLPVTIREDDMLARAEITVNAPGGPYRGFVCTVYIDGISVDHFTNPGKYDVMLSGRSPGVHRLMVHLQVAKERYGKSEKKVEETFIVEPTVQVHRAPEINGDDIIVPEETHFGTDDLYEEGKGDDANTKDDSEE
ncbi:PEGA domain-containing protein [Methanogenium marinum]|uniref:PEGA domain-containing protein n=1 Tax=Methanogenium marinum TaxID=348610 RepID=A0A9Q4KTF4_9EURY|nr:PEGA domain-containing protein [Methanogenium marinum]MDE4908416.1 PEGA domain-containing protein [Methanogenium marinum]